MLLLNNSQFSKWRQHQKVRAEIKSRFRQRSVNRAGQQGQRSTAIMDCRQSDKWNQNDSDTVSLPESLASSYVWQQTHTHGLSWTASVYIPLFASMFTQCHGAYRQSCFLVCLMAGMLAQRVKPMRLMVAIKTQAFWWLGGRLFGDCQRLAVSAETDNSDGSGSGLMSWTDGGVFYGLEPDLWQN